MDRSLLAPLALVALVLAAGPAGAQVNLLVNRNFGDDPNSFGNGWTVVGTGQVIHDPTAGEPLPPSARLVAAFGESVALHQCVPARAGARYDLEAYSFTYVADVGSHNELRVSFHDGDACTGALLETAVEDHTLFLSWAFRYRHDIVAPAGTRSARVELVAETGPMAQTEVAFDDIALLPEPAGLAPAALTALAALAARRCGRRRALA